MFSFGEIGNKNEDFLSNTFSNVFQTFVTDTLSRNNLITTGQNPGGNLSQAQIQAGQRPVEQTIIPSANGSVMNSLGGGMLGMSSTMTWVAVGGVVLLVGIYLLRK